MRDSIKGPTIRKKVGPFFLHDFKNHFNTTKSRKLKRAAQALPQRQRLRGVCAA
jgi:hypothetical protein